MNRVWAAHRRGLLVLAFALLALVSSHARAGDASDAPAAHVASSVMERIIELTVESELEEAKKLLVSLDPKAPQVAFALARVALADGDCDRAAQLASRPDVMRLDGADLVADVSRGCARVTAASWVERIEAHRIEIRFQDEFDRVLTPLIVETVNQGRDSLTRDLGVSWPNPTRIFVVRDLLSLSAVTGLPYEATKTTGTVGVAKWGRVTLLTPRASRHGYGWRDTLVHELTHLAITQKTLDRAPLWLQEGLAKRGEVRWRAPGPFDDRPGADALAVRAIARKLDLPLDKLGPSLAMLPSADAAQAAFAEVTSFVAHFIETQGPKGLTDLLLAFRRGMNSDDALRSVSGMDLKAWDTKWRAHVLGLPSGALPPTSPLAGLVQNGRQIGERMRLSELLLTRGHASPALVQLEQIAGSDVFSDPMLRTLRGRVFESLGRTKDAADQVADPKDIVASYGRWWALRGRLARARGDEGVAAPAFTEAVAGDPFGIEAACESLDPQFFPPNPEGRRLCEEARHWAEPLAD